MSYRINSSFDWGNAIFIKGFIINIVTLLSIIDPSYKLNTEGNKINEAL